MRGNAPGRFKALADNNLFVLETVTWTLMGRHGKPSDNRTMVDAWARQFPNEFADCVHLCETHGECGAQKVTGRPRRLAD